MTGIARSIVVGIARRIAFAYRLGGRTVRFAPLFLLPAAATELAQHGAEYHLGMFDSLAAFRGLAMDPTRWAFGYAKVAGFMATILLVARFWAVDGVMARVPRIGWRFAGRLALGIAASIAIAVLDHGLGHANAAFAAVSGIVNFLISTGLTLYVMGALFGDEEATLRWCFTAGWPRAVTTTLFAAAAFVPCQLLHLLDHKIAIGSPAPVVATAMLWDGLFIGLFGALVGSALFVGFHYGPGWRGWGRPLPG